MRPFLRFVLVIFISTSSVYFPPERFAFADDSSADSKNIRGAKNNERHDLDPGRSAVSGIFYIPRLTTDAALYGVGKTAETLSDKDFIEKVKDILYIYERKLMIFPLAGYASGFRPTYGGGLYYKNEGLTGLFRGTVYDAHYWSLSLKSSYRKYIGWASWKTSLLGSLETKDDRRFYGLGADPRHDSRNTFLADNDYGVYTEDRRKLQWSSGLFKPGDTYGVEYLGYYQRKTFDDSGKGIDDLHEIFDTSRIPGFDHPVSQIYNELSAVVDTRKNKKMLSSGLRGEIYGGFSNGTGDNESDLFRSGFDLAGFIPIFKKDRLIVPRAVFDLVENLDSVEIPFSEYPRHHSFRGTSSREIVRSERVSMVPSIEYQWPISHMFTGNVFFDTLVVGPRATELNWDNALWAAGGGINLHILSKELARIEVAGGSEGFQALLTFGTALKSNHRADW